MASFRQVFTNFISNLSGGSYQPANQARPFHSSHSDNSRTSNQRTNSRPPDSSFSSSTGHNARTRSYSQTRPTLYNQTQTRSQPRSGSMSRTDTAHQGASRSAKAEDKIDINDIRDLSEIYNLGAKQLKYILAKNCVDFKGVFEKEVLREKVMLLWIDHNESIAKRRTNFDPSRRSQDDLNDVSDDQVCKICMEHEINSVLLECGHLVTCVDCGKKLVECPICRQNIVRVARTFKA